MNQMRKTEPPNKHNTTVFQKIKKYKHEIQRSWYFQAEGIT